MDYYSFGMGIKEREWKDSNFSYRFAFNGQERDDEVSGEGNSYTAEFWQYDSRLGRRFNLDPLMGKYPWQSAYACFNNNPQYFMDSKGLEGEEGNKEVQKHNVASGETLSGIAQKYHTSVENLAKWNDIEDVNRIDAGASLIVSDPSRPANNAAFESYPAVKPSTGWLVDTKNVDADGNVLNTPTEMTVSNGADLAIASIVNFDIANLSGGLLVAVQSDPDMTAYQVEIFNTVKSDPRYGKEAFYITGFDVREFGGKRGSGDEWFSGGENDPVLKKETWQVGANQLTWALRHATVKYWAEVSHDGTITIQYRLYDTLDLSGNEGRSGTYNTISEIGGYLYHDIGGGNKNLQTRGQWSISR